MRSQYKQAGMFNASPSPMWAVVLKGLPSNSPFAPVGGELHTYRIEAATRADARAIGERMAAERGLEFYYVRAD